MKIQNGNTALKTGSRIMDMVPMRQGTGTIPNTTSSGKRVAGSTGQRSGTRRSRALTARGGSQKDPRKMPNSLLSLIPKAE